MRNTEESRHENKKIFPFIPDDGGNRSARYHRRRGRSGITDGHVILFVPGSTASLTTIEYERGVIENLRDAIERIAPRAMRYRHDERWGDGNGYSHVRAALLGPSLAIPVIEGSLTLGTWQQIILIDFDNRPRHRRIVGQVSGQ